MSWKILWDAKAKAEGSLKIFMADCMMPYWLQCQRCKKWRQVPREVMVNKDYILSFWCGVPYGKKKVVMKILLRSVCNIMKLCVF